MANNTFIQVPHDVTDSISLKRFLNKLILELDIAFSNRGSSGFTNIASLEDINAAIKSLGSSLVDVKALAASNELLLNNLGSSLVDVKALAASNELLINSLGSSLVDVEALAASNELLINSLNTKVGNLEAGNIVVTITADYTATSESTRIICDSLTEISVTLPDPADFLSGSRSKTISITTKNIGVVNILPFGTELVAGEASQSLIVPNKSLTFFTDGVDWYVI